MDNLFSSIAYIDALQMKQIQMEQIQEQLRIQLTDKSQIKPKQQCSHVYMRWPVQCKEFVSHGSSYCEFHQECDNISYLRIERSNNYGILQHKTPYLSLSTLNKYIEKGF